MSAEEQKQRHGEDEQQRRNREVIELLNELRVALPGVQVLFAFLLIVPFSQGFSSVTRGVGLPRPGDDRRHFLDHGRPVRGCGGGGERCWARRGVRMVLVRAAAA